MSGQKERWLIGEVLAWADDGKGRPSCWFVENQKGKANIWIKEENKKGKRRWLSYGRLKTIDIFVCSCAVRNWTIPERFTSRPTTWGARGCPYNKTRAPFFFFFLLIGSAAATHEHDRPLWWMSGRRVVIFYPFDLFYYLKNKTRPSIWSPSFVFPAFFFLFFFFFFLEIEMYKISRRGL
jgi:hypothetical protein